MLTDAQKKIRRRGITGSELAILLGLTPKTWGSLFDIWEEKIGRIDRDVEETFHMRRGIYLEAAIRSWLKDELELEEIRYGSGLGGVEGTLVHPTEPLVIATPDGAVYEQGKLVAAIEIKSPSSFTWHQWSDPLDDPEGIPIYYLPQITWEMAVLGVKECIVGALVHDNLRTYRIPFNEALFNTMLKKVKWFWSYVEAETPPPVLDGNPATRAWLNKKYKVTKEDVELEVSDSYLEEVIDALREAIDMTFEANEKYEFNCNRVKEWLKDSPGVEGPWGKIYWRTNKKGSRVFRPYFREEK